MKKSLALYTSLLLLGTGLTGCATMSVEECKVADWQSVGYRDGKAGRDQDYLLNHAKACGKASITPNKIAWEQGRQQGLQQYCTPANAFELGRSGSRINLVCPSAVMSNLQTSNQKGLKLYQLRQDIDSDTREREKLVERYQKLRNGENLDFKTEKEARAYLSELPYKIDTLTRRIKQNTLTLQQLGY